MAEDAQLIRDSVRGDMAAYGQLVQRYRDRLFNAMIYMVRCREEAEDVVQEAFIQAFANLGTFHGRSAFYTWLYRIALNVALGRMRRKRLEVSSDQLHDLMGMEPIDGGDSPSSRLERLERVAQVRQALAALHDRHRSILVLREIEGCCYETIAEILDIRVGTVRSRLHRARLLLKEELERVLEKDLAE